MSHVRHVVVAGDNLWKLAETHLGHGSQWPRIWRYNNRREVIAVTGRGVPDPDLIHVGQLLLIPALAGASRATGGPAGLSVAPQGLAGASTSAGTASGGGGALARMLGQTPLPLVFKFRLGDIWLPPVFVPGASIQMRMEGDVLVSPGKSLAGPTLTSGGELELQATHQANRAFGSLVSEQGIAFDPATHKVTLSSMLVGHGPSARAVAVATGFEVSSENPIPHFKAEFRVPQIGGHIEGCAFAAVDVKIVVEVTPWMQGAGPRQALAPALAPAAGPDWRVVTGAALLATAVVVATATIVEDFVTLGAGIADDPLTLGAATQGWVRGLELLRAGGGTLPQALESASAFLRVSLVAVP